MGFLITYPSCKLSNLEHTIYPRCALEQADFVFRCVINFLFFFFLNVISLLGNCKQTALTLVAIRVHIGAGHSSRVLQDERSRSSVTELYKPPGHAG